VFKDTKLYSTRTQTKIKVCSRTQIKIKLCSRTQTLLDSVFKDTIKN